jgi:hypothetical protein
MLCVHSTYCWYVYTLLKSVLLVGALEICCKESMPLGIRGNGDLYEELLPLGNLPFTSFFVPMGTK